MQESDFEVFRRKKERVKQALLKSNVSCAALKAIEEGAIRKRGKAARDMNWLRESLLELLAYGAVEDRISHVDSTFAKPMRIRARQLRGLAEQMRTVAKHAERLQDNQGLGLDAWARLTPGALRPPHGVDPMNEWCPDGLPDQMRQCADAAEYQARAFGFYTRHLARPHSRALVKALKEVVRSNTGRSFNPQLTLLLNDAHRAAGSPHTFSTEEVRKTMERTHGM